MSAPLEPSPQERLAGAAETLTRDWLAELIRARPLADAVTVPLEAVAADGPRAVEELVRALGADVALGELATLLSRFGDPADRVRAGEALRAVVWHAAAGELDAPTTRRLADRLGRLVSDAVAGSLSDAAPRLDALIAAGERFALVLLEVTDRRRLGELDGLGDCDALLRGRLRAGEHAVGEAPGRWRILLEAPRDARARAAQLAGPLGEHHGVPLTCTAGVASFPEHGASEEELVEHADRALLAAQAAGVSI